MAQHTGRQHLQLILLLQWNIYLTLALILETCIYILNTKIKFKVYSHAHLFAGSRTLWEIFLISIIQSRDRIYYWNRFFLPVLMVVNSNHLSEHTVRSTLAFDGSEISNVLKLDLTKINWHCFNKDILVSNFNKRQFSEQKNSLAKFKNNNSYVGRACYLSYVDISAPHLNLSQGD